MPEATRAAIARARRVVVKIGSSSLTGSAGGHLVEERLVDLVDELAVRHTQGTQIVLVSSGAIAAGIGPLGLERRPADLATQQAAASVGQGVLVSAYRHAFRDHEIKVGQVLLTVADVTQRTHYTNARRTLQRLLELGVVPVINENDTVATDEIRFGDNDRLAALTAHLVGADAMVLLTDVDALYTDNPKRPGARRIPVVDSKASLAEIRIGGTGSSVGSGGMQTKVEAAGIASAAGIPTVLTSAGQVAEALAGRDVGTLFLADPSPMPSRTLWLRHATSPRGSLVIDDGAVVALTRGHKSLLPAGITEVRGLFRDGDAVDVCALDGRTVARGLSNFGSWELPAMLGRSTKEIAEDLGQEFERVVIHRDHMVVF